MCQKHVKNLIKNERLVNDNSFFSLNSILKKIFFYKLAKNIIQIGANDGKTRERCVDKIQFSPASKKDILAWYGYLNNEIWNCRHSWDEMSSSPEDQGYNPKKFEGKC